MKMDLKSPTKRNLISFHMRSGCLMQCTRTDSLWSGGTHTRAFNVRHFAEVLYISDF